jgi:hypothetical protein
MRPASGGAPPNPSAVDAAWKLEFSHLSVHDFGSLFSSIVGKFLYVEVEVSRSQFGARPHVRFLAGG